MCYPRVAGELHGIKVAETFDMELEATGRARELRACGVEVRVLKVRVPDDQPRASTAPSDAAEVEVAF